MAIKKQLAAFRDLLFSALSIPFQHRPCLPVTRLSLKTVASSIRHIHGETHFLNGPEDVVGLCRVRNGEEYIDIFLEHHFSLGTHRIVLLDNGSNDRTIDKARRHSKVTIIQSKLPFRSYKISFAAFLRRQFSQEGWSLLLDIDELFDYPFSSNLKLPKLTQYLNRYSYNAVLAHMLEMFSDKSLLELSHFTTADIRQEYCYYDLSSLKQKELKLPAESIPSRCQVTAGGIRRDVFGIGGCLFKFPLIRLSQGLQLSKLAHHRINGGRVRLADFSSVLFHYLFTGSLLRKSRKAVRENNYKNGSGKYRRFVEVLSDNPHLSLYELARKPQEYKDTEDLIRQRFLSCSRRFRE